MVSLVKCMDALIMEGVVTMEDKYVVCYKFEDGTVNCEVATGNRIANLYGFGDCTGIEVLYIYRICEDGHLFSCHFRGTWVAPFNRLLIECGIAEYAMYEWDDH